MSAAFMPLLYEIPTFFSRFPMCDISGCCEYQSGNMIWFPLNDMLMLLYDSIITSYTSYKT